MSISHPFSTSATTSACPFRAGHVTGRGFGSRRLSSGQGPGGSSLRPPRALQGGIDGPLFFCGVMLGSGVRLHRRRWTAGWRHGNCRPPRHRGGTRALPLAYARARDRSPGACLYSGPWCPAWVCLGVLCANDADCTEIEGTSASAFPCGMRPLNAGCD